MCMMKAPKVPKTPPPAQYQTMQVPKDQTGGDRRLRLRRRGMWASVFTGPQGITSTPMTTGTGGGITGG